MLELCCQCMQMYFPLIKVICLLLSFLVKQNRGSFSSSAFSWKTNIKRLNKIHVIDVIAANHTHKEETLIGSKWGQFSIKSYQIKSNQIRSNEIDWKECQCQYNKSISIKSKPNVICLIKITAFRDCDEDVFYKCIINLYSH